MTSTTDVDSDIPARDDSRRRARTWTWAGTAVAVTAAAVLLAPTAAADPVVPPGIPCASQVQAFYNARQALGEHNDEPHVFPTPEQVQAYDAQAQALYDAQIQAQQQALACARALAGSRAAVLPDPLPRVARPVPPAPPATRPSPPAPGEEPGDDDWAEKMQDKIYDWFKENLERVEKYQEKQQEEQDRCDQAPEPPSGSHTTSTPAPAPPACPAAPTTAPNTF